MECQESERLAEQVWCRLSGRVHDLRALPRGGGVLLRAHRRSHQAKFLTQDLAVVSTYIPLLTNEIKALCRCGRRPN